MTRETDALVPTPVRRDTESAPDGSGPPPLEWGPVDDLRRAVLTFLVARCRDEHEAEDLTHEALLRAARFRGGLQNPERERAWVVQIAANLLSDHARREGRAQTLGPEDPFWAVHEARECSPASAECEWFHLGDGQLEKDSLVLHLRRAWSELYQRDQRVLGAYYADGGSTSAAAAACEVEPALVRVRLFRARQRLEASMRRRISAARSARLCAC